jgi:hypothetical protein
MKMTHLHLFIKDAQQLPNALQLIQQTQGGIPAAVLNDLYNGTSRTRRRIEQLYAQHPHGTGGLAIFRRVATNGPGATYGVAFIQLAPGAQHSPGAFTVRGDIVRVEQVVWYAGERRIPGLSRLRLWSRKRGANQQLAAERRTASAQATVSTNPLYGMGIKTRLGINLTPDDIDQRQQQLLHQGGFDIDEDAEQVSRLLERYAQQ